MRVRRLSQGTEHKGVAMAERKDLVGAFRQARAKADDAFYAAMRQVAPGQWEYVEPEPVAEKSHEAYFKLVGTQVIASMVVWSGHGSPRFIGVTLGLSRVIRWTARERKRLPRTYFKVSLGKIYLPENLHRSAQFLARLAAPKLRLASIARAAENLAARKAGVSP